MTKEEIFGIAKMVLARAKDGVYSRDEYAAHRARVFSILGADAFREELEELFRWNEGDPENPFGGWVFRWETVPPWVKTDSRGREYADGVALGQSVRQRSHIVSFLTDDGHFVRYYFRDGAYYPCPDERLRERLQTEIFRYDDRLYKSSVVTEAAAVINQMPPAGPLALLDADESVVNFRNCLLDLKTLETRPHTPEVYSSVQLNACWPEEDRPTPVFTAFINQLCGGSREKAALLTQFLGLTLTNAAGWRIKRALFTYGPGNTGKSVLRSLLEGILGEGNYTSVDLAGLEEDKFAVAQLQGKRLAGSGDMRFMKVRELAVFKQLTGGDPLFAQYKGKDAFSFRYRGMLWFSSNEPPLFGGDRGDWVYERMLLFPCSNPVPAARRDPRLREKLLAERDAIVRKLICAARSVIEADYTLTVPAEMTEEIARCRRRNDVVEAFFTECCVLRKPPIVAPGDECTCKNIFEVFRLWCRDNNGGFVPKKSEFRATVARLLGIPEEDLTLRTMKTTYFVFTLTPETIGDYEEQIFVRRG